MESFNYCHAVKNGEVAAYGSKPESELIRSKFRRGKFSSNSRSSRNGSSSGAMGLGGRGKTGL
jgi:hypothetical protein